MMLTMMMMMMMMNYDDNYDNYDDDGDDDVDDDDEYWGRGECAKEFRVERVNCNTRWCRFMSILI